MSAHGQLARQFAITQNFDSTGGTIGKARAAECRFIYACAIVELIQRIQIHRDVTGRVTRIIETALGDAANERHLSAFKANSNRTAGARRLPFAAAPTGLAMATGFALAEPFPAMLGTRTRSKIV
jgi:hypothetical protein